MAAFIKSLSRLLGSPAKPAPALHLAAFGKHPGWNDHLDDLGLDTDSLISAKRLLYVQGISQNIDSGAWDKLDQSSDADTPGTIGRLDQFRHDFLWHMPPVLLAGRLWSSSDGKGRDKYPMVLCAQLTDLPDRFATHIVLPFLAKVHEQCAAATTANTVTQILNTERENLRSKLKDSLSLQPLTARQVAAVANHPDMHTTGIEVAEGSAPPMGGGFHRIVYQFVRGMSSFRTPAAKNSQPRRPEHVRLPACGMASQDALLFWLRFALTFLDASTPILLFAPEAIAPPVVPPQPQPAQPPADAATPVMSPASPPVAAPPSPNVPAWIDLIAGDPSPANLFCIKAGTKSLPFTSDIPYTLEPSFIRAIDTHLGVCATSPESAPLPAWPEL